MGNKKKFIITFLFMLFATFFGFILENSSMATDIWIEDYQLNETIMSAILDKLELTSFYSDPGELSALTENFNTMMRTVRARGDYHQVRLADCFFYKYNNFLNVAFNGWRDGFNDADDAALETYNFYIPLNFNDSSSNATTLREFTNWTYDGNNNITGVTVNTSSQPRWVFSNSNNTYSFTTQIVSNNIQTGIIDINASNSGDIRAVSTSSGLFLDNRVVLDYSPVMIYSRTSSGGYGLYFWGNFLYLEDYNSGDIEPTPTPIPGGGGGSSDLTTTNGLISDVNSSINSVASSGDFDFNSGDYLGAIGFENIVDPTDNFWDFIIEGLQLCLVNDVRYLEIEILGQTYILDNQAFNIQNPELSFLVTSATLIGFIILEFKFIHHLIVLVSTFDLGDILLNVRNMDISDFF